MYCNKWLRYYAWYYDMYVIGQENATTPSQNQSYENKSSEISQMQSLIGFCWIKI